MLDKLIAPLKAEDVEARIGTTSVKGFSLLLYKTARTDMHRLNEVCGMQWSNEHRVEDGNIVCKIGVWGNNQWIYREDVGTESMTEKEKGSYSDSFKRAGFRWGIGIELYESPFIWINWTMDGKKPKGLYGSDIVVSKYQVVDGKPQVEITVKGKVEFSNIKNKQYNITSGDNKPETPKITPHTPETTQDILNNAETQLNAIETLEDLEELKKEFKAEKGFAKYFQKRKDSKSLTTLTTMITATEERLK